jgi:cytochrome c-type biogenesis protein CcmE
MTSKAKKTLFFSLLGIVAIGLSLGLYFYNKGPICVTCASGTKISSAILYQTFSKDSITARKEYTGNILEVSGMVTRVMQNQQNQAIILLKTNESGASVNCTMEGPAESIKEGDAVTVKGICTGMGAGDADLGIAGDVYLTRCYMTK